MLRRYLIVPILLLLLHCSPQVDQPIQLTDNWRFRIDPQGIGESEGWYRPGTDLESLDTISVPANREDALKREVDGKAWYFIEFKNPGYRNSTALVIDSADDAAHVWVNGKPAGEHEGAGQQFRLDVTNLLQPGKNRLAILVEDFGGFGGLSGAVYLMPFEAPEELLKGKHYDAPVPEAPGWLKKAIVYELNTRQFSREGSFKAIEERLSELTDLGIDIIWLMPIHPIGEKNRQGSLGNPYSVKDYYAVNPEFGTPDDFKSLVQKIHSENLHVIIDLVASHTARDNALIAEHPDWYRKNESGEIVSPESGSREMAQLDYANPELWQYMIEMMAYWVRDMEIDGFHCSNASAVPLEFWRKARGELSKIKHVLMVAQAEAPEFNAVGFDMTYGGDIYRKMNDIAQGKATPKAIDESLLNERYTYPENSLRLRYTSGHDENAPLGNAISSMGKDAAQAAAVLTFTLPMGRPLIYNGQECGNLKALDAFEKDPIECSDSAYREFYQRLCRLYYGHDALSQGEMIKLESSNDDQLYAFVREVNWDRVLIIINFSDKPFDGFLMLENLDGIMQDYFRRINLRVSSSKKMLKLNPWEYRVYIEAEFKQIKKQSVTIPVHGQRQPGTKN
ncbi:beta galactosidase jelly roll domain-containing protein [candidate division KSB1 bacterium]|nr:beta galactosidase jelly roll domain-containing protein [candidate division KSB1 bacterium]